MYYLMLPVNINSLKLLTQHLSLNSKTTWNDILIICKSKKITTLYFECHYIYRKGLNGSGIFQRYEIVFKCGIETFDNNFRNKILKKGIVFFDSLLRVYKY